MSDINNILQKCIDGEAVNIPILAIIIDWVRLEYNIHISTILWRGYDQYYCDLEYTKLRGEDPFKSYYIGATPIMNTPEEAQIEAIKLFLKLI